jgi:hypothetical protein
MKKKTHVTCEIHVMTQVIIMTFKVSSQESPQLKS